MTSKTTRVILIDDESKSRETLRTFLHDYCPDVEVIGEADGVLAAYKLLKQLTPDAIFLDVQMGDGTGFDLLRKFPGPPFQVIFTTAFDEFALKAFQFNAIDYLLKPIDVDELIRAVQKIQPDASGNSRYSNLVESLEKKTFEKMALSSSDGLHFVGLEQIIRLEADTNYTTFHLADAAKITVAKTIKYFENLLPDSRFFRPHQSHIINLSRVNSILREDGGYLLMEDQFKVPVSRTKKEILLALVRDKFLQ